MSERMKQKERKGLSVFSDRRNMLVETLVLGFRYTPRYARAQAHVTHAHTHTQKAQCKTQYKRALLLKKLYDTYHVYIYSYIYRSTIDLRQTIKNDDRELDVLVRDRYCYRNLGIDCSIFTENR